MGKRRCRFPGCITILSAYNPSDYCGAHDTADKRMAAGAGASQRTVDGPQLIAEFDKPTPHCTNCGKRKYISGPFCAECLHKPHKKKLIPKPEKRPQVKPLWTRPPCPRCGGPMQKTRGLDILVCRQYRGPCGAYYRPKGGYLIRKWEKLGKDREWESTRAEMDGTLRPVGGHKGFWQVLVYIKPKEEKLSVYRQKEKPE